MTAVEIREYEGDGRDLAAMIGRVWRENFGGKFRMPIWDPGYFDWRLLDPRSGGKGYLITAYQGATPVACLLGEAMDFEAMGWKVRGTMTSWLTVDPKVRAPGLAIRLIEALRKRHQEHGLAFSMGYSSSDPEHPSRQFWDSLARRRPDDFLFLTPLTFWGRVFDAKAVSRTALDAFERWAPLAARHVPWAYGGWRRRHGVRPYEPSDLPRCLEWIDAASRGADVRVLWSAPRLDLQLGHPYARTLFVEGRGGRGGFVNWYPIRYLGTGEVRCGMIDYVVGDVGLAGKVALLKSAGRQMMDEGIHAAMMMGSSIVPTAALLAAGFVPAPAGMDYFCFFHEPILGLKPKLTFDVLFG